MPELKVEALELLQEAVATQAVGYESRAAAGKGSGSGGNRGFSQEELGGNSSSDMSRSHGHGCESGSGNGNIISSRTSGGDGGGGGVGEGKEAASGAEGAAAMGGSSSSSSCSCKPAGGDSSSAAIAPNSSNSNSSTTSTVAVNKIPNSSSSTSIVVVNGNTSKNSSSSSGNPPGGGEGNSGAIAPSSSNSGTSTVAFNETISNSSSASGTKRCTTGLWVCCWGGCSGLPLEAAQELHAQLTSRLGPNCLLGLESINCRQRDQALQLARFQGVTSLGFNFPVVSHEEWLRGSEEPWGSGGVAAAGGFRGLGGGGGGVLEGLEDWGSGQGFDLRPLQCLGFALRQLSICGAPKEGWGPPVSGELALGSLTQLTKLSLRKDWGDSPLGLGGVAMLTQLRELHLERGVFRDSELAGLSALTQLTLLYLVIRPKEAGADNPVLQNAELAAAFGADVYDLEGEEEDLVKGDIEAVSSIQQLGRFRKREILACLGIDWGPPLEMNTSWLKPLTNLSTAWLEVPSLNLAHLPTSLRELDAQKYSDADVTRVTCTAALELPQLRQLSLPRHADGQTRGQRAAVVEAVAAGCPLLQKLDLLGWELPARSVGRAVADLPWLQLLGMKQPMGVRRREREAALREAVRAGVWESNHGSSSSSSGWGWGRGDRGAAGGDGGGVGGSGGDAVCGSTGRSSSRRCPDRCGEGEDGGGVGAAAAGVGNAGDLLQQLQGLCLDSRDVPAAEVAAEGAVGPAVADVGATAAAAAADIGATAPTAEPLVHAAHGAERTEGPASASTAGAQDPVWQRLRLAAAARGSMPRKEVEIRWY